MSGRCNFQLKTVGTWWQTRVEVVVTWATKVEFHLLKIKNGSVLPQGGEPKKSWKLGTFDGRDSDVSHADGGAIQVFKHDL